MGSTLSAIELVRRLTEQHHRKTALPLSDRNRPTVTLVLGSGFSHPFVPTTRQIVLEDLPWWWLCLSGTTPELIQESYFNDDLRNSHLNDGTIQAFASELWVQVHKAAIKYGYDFELEPNGMPKAEHLSSAYTAIMSPLIADGPCNPLEVRRYFAALVKRANRKLNAAHLYLASLIQNEPNFTRTIFTTNFDPLLQRSLQLVNAEYYVSDRPDALQHPEDDHEVEALHLVHAHGSIYRYLLLNSPETIEDHAKRNMSILLPYFLRNTIVLIGYSGWDDAITLALEKVDQFRGNLYWCDRAKSLEESGLSKRARSIIESRDSAFYVRIDSADQLLVDLHHGITGELHSFVHREPIQAAIEQIERCDLTGIRVSRTRTTSPAPDGPAQAEQGKLDLGEVSAAILSRLRDADILFKQQAEEGRAAEASASTLRATLQNARQLYFDDQYEEAIVLLSNVIEGGNMLSDRELANALYMRGFSYDQRDHNGDIDRAISDFTNIIELRNDSIEEIANSLQSRAAMYDKRGQEGDIQRAIDDYTQIIEMANTPEKEVAKALYNRAVTYGQRAEEGDTERAITDYTAMIDMPVTPPELLGKALFNRGLTYGRREQEDDTQYEIADYTAIIENLDMPIEHVAKALVNRGFTYGQRAHEGDTEREIEDYTAVIENPDAPTDQVAKALVNRGFTYGQLAGDGDMEREITDYTTVIEMPDAPSEQIAKALYNRGLTYAQRGIEGDTERQIADYTAVTNIPDAPGDIVEPARAVLAKLKDENRDSIS
ncbi:MAG: SIR2 family protein [Phycisphaerales bacterium JB043]